MAIKTINVGNVVNDGSGDDLRTAFVKVNDNFAELNDRQGQDNTASNVGAGTGLFKEKIGVDLRFKSIVPGDGITITPGTSTVTIANSDHALVNEINSTIASYDLGTIIQHDIDENTVFLKWLKENIVMDMGSFINPDMTVGGIGNGGGGGSGNPGPIGYTGSAGTNGYTGSLGYTGSAGINGTIGYNGSKGYTGSAGTNGYSGSLGYTGSAGNNGTLGYTGSAGTAGSAGTNGYTGSAGPIASRSVVSVTSTSLANQAAGSFLIVGFKGYALYSIQTSAAAWVVIYSSLATRLADASRVITSDPTPGSGIIAEVITTGSQTIKLTPGVIGFSDEGTPSTNIPIKIVNLSGSTTTITVTLTLVCLEV
jgi:hypothetical protein